MIDTVGLLQRLSEAFGPSGFEDDVRDIITEVVTPLVDDIHVDPLGNVLATRRGRREDVLMLDAHMDEVGFLVSYVEESGFLRLSPLGGWDARVLPAHAVTVAGRDGGRVRGVVGTLPPHVTQESERSKAFKLEDLFVDIGATSRAEAEAMGVEVGCACVPGYPFERLDDDLVMGKAFDDRAGCTVAIGALDALGETEPELTLVFAFTISEELGLRGARTAAQQLQPRIALALEGTTAVDVPGVTGARKLASMGAGPTVTIADRSIIASRAVVTLLEETASKNGIPFQRKLPGGGGTDAGAIQTAGAGALVGVVSVPCRYIHAPLSLVRPSDVDAAIRLVTGFVEGAASLVTAAS
ncbi:MAG TPA: M42 family metallopeptidase [Actinomycetota bacterium]|nr:M42 family metallopeptidase [Actinomycetota bacterium]